MSVITKDASCELDEIKAHFDRGGFTFNISSWQKDFIEDLLEKYEEYGASMFATEKQIAKIHEIWEKVVNS